MSSSDLSQFANSTDKLTVSDINDAIIPGIITRLSQAKLSLSNNNTNINTKTNNDTTNNCSSSSGHSIEEDYRNMDIQLEKLRRDLTFIGVAFNNLKNFEDKAAELFKELLQHTLDKSLDDLGASSRNPTLRVEKLNAKLHFLCDIVNNLKHQVPSPHIPSTTESEASRNTRVSVSYGFDDLQVIDELPDLHLHTLSNRSNAFLDFRDIYNSLDTTVKLCLLCFALIPENEVVKKRFFVYWWVGEEFIRPLDIEEKTYEEMGDEIFGKLVIAGFVEAVNKKRRLVADTYKMNPLIRSAVIEFAKEAEFFDFDEKGSPTADFSKCYRACLVLNDSSKKKLRTGSHLDQKKLRTIFNVNEPYPDFFELDWFSKLKYVKVLYLGRWQNSAKHHIEVERSEYLKGMKCMKFLKFFSIRGVSNITKLPNSVCKLSSLLILDLRACHNLEVLPDGIGSLKKLTHLDISECYLLDYIPKGIALLSELLVLKGFVVGDRISADSCTFDELSGLRKLRKLSIYTNMKTFPTNEEVNILLRFEKLKKLTLVWGGGVNSYAKQDKATAKQMVATTKSLKKGGDKKKQDKGAAEPIATTTTTPRKSEDDKKQDKGAAEPIAITTTSPMNGGDNKKQDSAVAQPMTASTMNPENSVDRKSQGKGTAELASEGRQLAGCFHLGVGTKAHLTRKLLEVATFRKGPRPVIPEVFKELEKLDLQCYPQMTEPSWLMPDKLTKLKKLYIRGGELQNLGKLKGNDGWKVEILRLKFLSNLEMDWSELQSMVPHLVYLEKFECPKVTLVPCDENGLWLKP